MRRNPPNGYLQLDTVERVLDGLKVYVYSGVDVKGKFAFSLPYREKTSANTVDFWTKFRQVYPWAIRRVQTDNGSEFLGAFEAYLQQAQTPHLFIYPRCPKVNGCIERNQRTLSEEFLQMHEFAIRQPRNSIYSWRIIWYSTIANAPIKRLPCKRPWRIFSRKEHCLKCL